jgi:type II secretory pathway pseudopilin PulG
MTWDGSRPRDRSSEEFSLSRWASIAERLIGFRWLQRRSIAMPGQCHDRPGRFPRRAFSLLETVLVMGILVILAGIALPRYARSIQRYQADLGGRRVVADLRLAQSAARAMGQSRQVTFEVGSHTYRLPGLPGLNGQSGSYLVNLARAPYGARLVSADFAGSSAVMFDGWGIPSQSGILVVSVGSESRRIIVDRPTATVRIE